MRIGHISLPNRLFVAPMAGVTDRPFRQLCRRLGAGYAVSEMVTSQKDLWKSLKTSRRANHDGEAAPISVQIAGTNPSMMAEAAAYNIDNGAQIIDINMGCPAKKVCNVLAGSALMRDEPLAIAIVEAVVAVCAPRNVPVSLKMRTGWCAETRNAVSLARMAESAGVAMITVHGRTREQAYQGEAEYETIAAVKAALSIPVVANGDIDSPEKALRVLRATGADAVMIGRAAQGRPWIFSEIAHYLETGETLPAPYTRDVREWLVAHLHDHYGLYGEPAGVRTARKHIGWAVKALPGGEAFRNENEPDRHLQGSSIRRIRLVRRAGDAPCAAAFPFSTSQMTSKHIDDCVRESLEAYFKDLEGVEPHAMYDMILKVVEKPLLDVVMQHADGNQSRAAEWLGINRNTLRRKLLEHKLVK